MHVIKIKIFLMCLYWYNNDKLMINYNFKSLFLPFLDCMEKVVRS